MAEYNIIFAICLLINIVITFRSSPVFQKIFQSIFGGRRSTSPPTEEVDSLIIEDGKNSGPSKEQLKANHSSLIKKYLVVYLLAATSDWLQGPYVYALYDAYGFSKHDIAVLFVAGFGSSMVFGSFIGGMADACGRRKFVLLYCIVYAASCFTKHYNDYNILMFGRILGGIATSLLFSVFDSWLIRAHSIRSVDEHLSSSFASASYGNSIVAIIAGLLANEAANINDITAMFTGSKNLLHYGGFLNPFDIAFVTLCLCGLFALLLWDENYGDQYADGKGDDSDAAASYRKEENNACSGFQRALKTVFGNSEILLCGIISSLFEGSMYVFVFMWTPALKSLNTETELPFGVIFSTFMVCCMAGSSMFSLCMTKNFKIESLAIVIFGVGAISMAIIAIKPLESDTLVFIAMNAFEVCVGMYWPIMGTLKSIIVPESSRAAIYNLYRIPLNGVVLFSLLTDLTTTQSFLVNTFMLGTATVLQNTLNKKRAVSEATAKQSTPEASVETA
eukprot:CAMPEP_0195511852 /NCGR_PEP_ID=MMETSP0794_2-20130614/4023_1 /TAXON_ID=515487 /ORGANISM="Stephanopyxis turris, Strain CCMP 815" /LENGTH=504 /DNA_ID=CAMNT_0040639523 /DNA_START=99 /DNA_END=1613 /DNA_ORIENTATION=+